jgi:alpha-methylacyl-CoA racemase
MTGPLSGVRVVVLSGMGPVPFLSMLLSDMGASVVRVVRPRNRPARPVDQTAGLRDEADVVNRGVGSVVVDLKDPASLRQLTHLLRHVDVFVEGFRPGVAERLGLGPDVLRASNPRMVYARLTGFGQEGPLAHEAGHDINYLAQSGALSAMARRGEAPRPPINLLGDYAGGGTVGALGVVAALYEARTSGQGQVVDVAMVDGVALLTARLHGLRAAGLYGDEAGTNWIDSGAPFYDVYRCRDDRFLAVGALEPDFYRQFLEGLGVDTEDWPAQDDRARWPELRQHIGTAIASRTRDEWASVYEGTDACVSAVLTFDEAEMHPHNRQRGLYVREGGVLHPAAAPRLSATPFEPPRPIGQAYGGVEELAGTSEAWGPADVL